MRFLSIVAILAFATTAEAAKRQRYSYEQSQVVRVTPHSTTVRTYESVSGNTPMAEVNAARLARGYKPFIEDPALTAAAQTCAELRARYLIAGHTANDFAALSPGVTARAAGCGAMAASWGWNTCCTYENYQYAGAAIVWGRDGQRYMHLFVR